MKAVLGQIHSIKKSIKKCNDEKILINGKKKVNST